MDKLKKEIDKTGIILTLEEQQRILEKEGSAERSKRITRELVKVLVVLKTNGIDLSKIVQGGENPTIIEDLIKEKEIEEQNKIINELQEISEEITKDWSIGERLSKQKTRNMDQLKKEIDKAGIKLTPEEQQKILEKQEQMSRITTREFVQVLVVLKTNGIDLSKIVQNGKNRSKIEDLIKEKDEEEQKQIINAIKEISEGIKKDYSIGGSLNNQKTRNMDKLKKEIKEAGLEEILTDEERKVILEKSTKKKVKQTVVEQKNKGELGQNQQIEVDIFEETITQAEQIQEAEASAR